MKFNKSSLKYVAQTFWHIFERIIFYYEEEKFKKHIDVLLDISKFQKAQLELLKNHVAFLEKNRFSKKKIKEFIEQFTYNLFKLTTDYTNAYKEKRHRRLNDMKTNQEKLVKKKKFNINKTKEKRN